MNRCFQRKILRFTVMLKRLKSGIETSDSVPVVTGKAKSLKDASTLDIYTPVRIGLQIADKKCLGNERAELSTGTFT